MKLEVECKVIIGANGNTGEWLSIQPRRETLHRDRTVPTMLFIHQSSNVWMGQNAFTKPYFLNSLVKLYLHLAKGCHKMKTGGRGLGLGQRI